MRAQGTIATLALVLASVIPATAQDSGLPDFGEGNAVSLSQEYVMGRAWLMQFRRQAPIVSDPQLQDYTESLIFRLAETSQLQERRLEVVLVDNRSINAFAVPGGVVGVHNGLIFAARTESELASVLGHELAHLSQRHFSRSVENSQKSQTFAMAGMLAGLVAVAAGGGEAGMAAIVGSQAAAQDASLRYSRQHEQEADRVGFQNLVANSTTPARKPVKTAWHELLRALIQNCPDLNGMPNAANGVFGSSGGNFDRSASPAGRISEGLYSQ